MATHRKVPRVLSIAGSDSGGGAGIQADLKAIASCGAHGMTAITAITAQNTVGVRAVQHVEPEIIKAQIAAVIGDIGVDAVKLGMLGRTATIEAVEEALRPLDRSIPIVIDPVMVSESGSVLLESEARGAMITRLFPLATVVTPNLPEARAIVETAATLNHSALSHAEPAGDLSPATGPSAAAEDLARAILTLGPRTVVVTGGHRETATDLFCDCAQLVEIPGERFGDGAAHGSGCTHSSVLAAALAAGADPLTAARAAKVAAARAVANGLRSIGAGAGPVDVLGLTSLGTGFPGIAAS